MGRSHDYWCEGCQCHYSPFDFKACPGCGEVGVYDLNLEMGEGDEPLLEIVPED